MVCCLVVGYRVRVSIMVRIRFNVWVVNSDYAHVFVLLSVVIVTLPFFAIEPYCSVFKCGFDISVHH